MNENKLLNEIIELLEVQGVVVPYNDLEQLAEEIIEIIKQDKFK